MPKRHAHAEWKGSLEDGSGTMSYGSYEGAYSFASRFEDGQGTNPEELIGAAHAGCFSMALAAGLDAEGYEPESIETSAEVTIQQKGDDFVIPSVVLKTRASVPNIDRGTFRDIAEAAKDNCPVSKALRGVDIRLEASLN